MQFYLIWCFEPSTDVPFSHGSKRVFEEALEHSKKMGHIYIALEHIAIVLLAVDDSGAHKVLDKYVPFVLAFFGSIA